jgi:hypothetical protein
LTPQPDDRPEPDDRHEETEADREREDVERYRDTYWPEDLDRD